jgi:hypothetical protein
MVHVHAWSLFPDTPRHGGFQRWTEFCQSFLISLGASQGFSGGVPHSPLADSRGEVWTDKPVSDFNELSVCQLLNQMYLLDSSVRQT